MELTLDQRWQITAELKHFSKELDLSDSQRNRLKTALTEAYEKLQEFRQENPNVSKEELAQKIAANRGVLRERVVVFLSAKQLATWDKEMAKLSGFLRHKAASA